MRKPIALAVLLLAPSLTFAQSGAENVLPSRSQLYFRWDGAKAHRAEFDKTAFGKTLKGDTGKFLKELWAYATENIEQAIDQADPVAGGIFRDVIQALGHVSDGGVVLGVELEKVTPPKVNGLLVFPGAAGEGGKLLALIQKAAEAARADIKDAKVGRRLIHSVDIADGKGVYLGWWNEGEDAVLMIGTTEPVEYAKMVDAKQTGLVKHPLYKKVAGFKDYTTNVRAFFDMQGLAGVVEDASPEAAKFVDALGVKGVKSVTFVAGYEGIAFRNVLEVDIPGPRKGLLSLASTKTFNLKDLPPLPSDANSISASTMDIGKAYDVIYALVETGVKIFAPDKAQELADAIKAAENLIQVNLRDDLFGCFGDMAVSYSSPAEGLLGLGSTTLLKVKDGKKLMASIDKIVKNIPNQGFEVSLKKKMYKDVEINDLNLKIDLFSLRLVSFAVYKDWFILSGYPQGIKGFVLRSEGELPTWKADGELVKVLNTFPQKYTGIQISDPRGTIQGLLAFTPLLFDTINRFTVFIPNLRPFELDTIPHAQEATRYLFPSVTVTTDDGKMLRSVSRGSIGLP